MLFQLGVDVVDFLVSLLQAAFDGVHARLQVVDLLIVGVQLLLEHVR